MLARILKNPYRDGPLRRLANMTSPHPGLQRLFTTDLVALAGGIYVVARFLL